MRLLFVLAVASCGAPPSTLESTGCPPVGSLVITELGIRGVSYVEIYNAGSSTLTLDALTLSITGSGAPRHTEIASSIASGKYQAIPVTTLPDAGGMVAVTCEGRPIDEARYASTKSDVQALDGAAPPDAALNDLPEHWCAQPGSAGGPNGPCGDFACVGAGKPVRGDLLVNEVMRDPLGADAEGEWIELYVAADDPVVLDGLEVEEVATSTRKYSLVAPPCFAVEPKTLVLLPLGGADEPRLVRGSGLFNDEADLTLRVGNVVIDQVAVTCGQAGTSCAWVDGDWCEAVAPTPGEENSCAP